MPLNIDYDRGVIKRIHPSGAEVYMYRDDPGVFLNAFGKPVTKELAENAGFDIPKYSLARRKKEMLAKAVETIEAELGGDEPGTRKVVLDRDGFHLISIGLGRHILEDPDGNNLTPEPLTEEEGVILFAEMVPETNTEEVKHVETSEASTADDDGMVPKFIKPHKKD